MRNRIIYILSLAICGLLQVSCSPRLMKPASGPCHWDLEPLIHSRNQYDIRGDIIDKSIVRDSIKFGKPIEILSKESNYILGSRQGLVPSREEHQVKGQHDDGRTFRYR